jgi:hypothetical protein
VGGYYLMFTDSYFSTGSFHWFFFLGGWGGDIELLLLLLLLLAKNYEPKIEHILLFKKGKPLGQKRKRETYKPLLILTV